MKGSYYLKISGILLVIGGIMTSLVYGAMGLLLGVGSSRIHDPIMALGGALVTGAFTSLLVVGIFQIVVGALALKYNSVCQKGPMLLVMGIILFVADLVSWILYGLAGSFSLSALGSMALNLLIPAICILGAYLNKKEYDRPLNM